MTANSPSYFHYLKGLFSKQKNVAVNNKLVDDDKSGKRNVIFNWVGIFIIIVVFFMIGFGIGYLAFSNKSTCSSNSEAIVSPNTSLSSGAAGMGQMIDATASTTPPDLAQASTSQELVPTVSYPGMTAIERVPVVQLDQPTFEIPSFVLETEISSVDTVPHIATPRITFTLNATKTTEKIELHFGVKLKYGISMLNSVVPLEHEVDNRTQILTIKLPPTVDKSNLTIQFIFMVPNNAFEKIFVPCGPVKCSVFVNKKLSLLVPHFHDLMKHPWSVKVDHQSDIKVLTNSKTGTTLSASLLPRELSFVIIQNLQKHAIGTQVESYYSSLTNASQVSGLEQTLKTALDSKKNHPTLSKEIFSIVVVPSKEDYEFYGKNVAVVGDNLLNANREIMLEFVWRWITRMGIYEKVKSSDNNPTWIYDHSAVFLSTSVVSAKKDIWKKHHYDVCMESDHRNMKMGSKQEISYEDEHRYLQKPEVVGRVSTVLGMLISATDNKDPIARLDAVRSSSSSNKFFFVNSDITLTNGQTVQVDKLTSCYVDSLDIPRLHISRFDSGNVVVQRSGGGTTDKCDILLSYVTGGKKEHVLLAEKDTEVKISSGNPILLSGDAPSYGYTMDQAEFDKLQTVLDSYDKLSIGLLLSNSFNAASEGKLSYESVQTFMKSALQKKLITVDEAVDSLMWTISNSRNDKLASHVEAIIANVLKEGGSSNGTVSDYIYNRFVKSVDEEPLFQIEKMKTMYKKCGDSCRAKVVGLFEKVKCVINSAIPDCPHNSHILEVYVCAKIAENTGNYETFEGKHTNCADHPCLLPILRGLLCSKIEGNLVGLFNKAMALDVSTMVNRQIVMSTIKGLASNDLYKPTLLPYLMDNWHLLHQKYSKYPSLLGFFIDTIASTISTREQLNGFKNFVNYHGTNLEMFREFDEQLVKAEKWIEWNRKYSEVFSRLFAA